ncbi:hypothetical protein PR202_gb20594 [Eleusine coracana subsp. coracana]|uniref:Uncharacterized protein n=1 Tax=Eleusine coracana subsp. coracana TaxID=191504 RepID=A0AAV5FAT7_ELECO|nr:hypothetical protein PR202_gb20594 [Eleusine coracana subsp. coracana]
MREMRMELVVFVCSFYGILSPFSIAYSQPADHHHNKSKLNPSNQPRYGGLIIQKEAAGRGACLTVVGDDGLMFLQLIGALQVGQQPLGGLCFAPHRPRKDSGDTQRPGFTPVSASADLTPPHAGAAPHAVVASSFQADGRKRSQQHERGEEMAPGPQWAEERQEGEGYGGGERSTGVREREKAEKRGERRERQMRTEWL